MSVWESLNYNVEACGRDQWVVMLSSSSYFFIVKHLDRPPSWTVIIQSAKEESNSPQGLCDFPCNGISWKVYIFTYQHIGVHCAHIWLIAPLCWYFFLLKRHLQCKVQQGPQLPAAFKPPEPLVFPSLCYYARTCWAGVISNSVLFGGGLLKLLHADCLSQYITFPLIMIA